MATTSAFPAAESILDIKENPEICNGISTTSAKKICPVCGQTLLSNIPHELLEVEDIVVEQYGVSVNELLKHDRRHEICQIRHIAWWLASKTRCSNAKIAEFFQRDKSSITHGICGVNALIARDGDVADELEGLRKKLESRL